MRLPITLFILLLVTASSFAEDTTAVKHKRVSLQYLKVNFDDDYFNIYGKGTDQYYTAGWQMDGCYKRNSNHTPLTDRLLTTLPGCDNLYFYGMSRRIYTPVNMDSSSVFPGDRPYASVLTIQHGVISTNPSKGESLTTEVGIGAIGPMTYGGNIQIWFHRALGDSVPYGWGSQIHNDFIFDYRLNYERQIYKPSENLKLLANVDCEAGTLVDNMGVGITLGFGKFTGTFARENLQIANSEGNPDKLRINFYMHPTVRVVMYNSTLEGGFFSKSPYVIAANDIDYVYLQYDIGIVMTYKRIGFSFSQKTRTAEFRNGQIQQVGSFTISVPVSRKS